MSDSYQAIYDAVRSRLSNADIGAAVQEVLRAENIGFYAQQAFNSVGDHFTDYSRPSVYLRPKMYPDGNQWCVLYGNDLQEGLAGFGESPYLAMIDFDKRFYEQTKAPTGEES